MADHSPQTSEAARLIHAAAEQGWPPTVVDLVATLAIAGIPHRIEPKDNLWLELSVPEEHIRSTGIVAALWHPDTPDGWRSTRLNDQGCQLLAARLRLPITSLMYLQPPADPH